MGACCVSCEVLYLSLYALHWPVFEDWSITSPWHGIFTQMESDTTPPQLSILMLIAQVAMPGFLIKQIINLAQLFHAMYGLWLHDLKTM